MFMISSVACSNKEIRYAENGDKIITMKSDAAIYEASQAKAFAAYYESLQTPMVIATMTAPDGSIIKIHNQIIPLPPVILQHKNQYIKPIIELGKYVVGGVVIDRALTAIVRGAGDTIVSNTGDGMVTVDKSDNITNDITTDVTTTSADGNGIIKNSSDNPIDNTVTNADPIVVTNNTVQVVEPEIVLIPTQIVDPVIVNPEIVIP